jgi:tRNA modification GTPase
MLLRGTGLFGAVTLTTVDKMTDLQEPIVVLSSAAGPGTRAIVRLSGAEVLPLAAGIFSSHVPLEHKRRCWEGGVRLPEIYSPLSADLYFFPGPHSYTGQDLVELHVLSSPPLIELLVSQLLAQGARAALPGELTMRAFLAGKLDLTKAEAVLAVIEAGERDELKHALAQLAGGVTRPLGELRDDLLNLLADVEAGLDFSEEDLQFVGEVDLFKRLGKAMALVTLVGKQVDQRSLAHRPFRVVLAGRPNVGKSRLFNALSGGRALVSVEAGTTRDYLVQRLELHGILIDLVDTAGWHTAADIIASEAQALGRTQADEADLLLLCVQGEDALSEEESELLGQRQHSILLTATKCDENAVTMQRFSTSAMTGLGLDELRLHLSERARSWARPALAPSLSRCRYHVTACLEHLRRAHSTALFGDPAEVLAMELRGALDQLGEMVGAVYTDDLLDRIFSRFCIGK